MQPAPRPTLDYGALKSRPRVPRVLAFLAAALAGVYLIFLILAVLTAPDRADAARAAFHQHRYMVPPAIAFILYLLLRCRTRDPERRVTFLSILSVVLVLLNPALMDIELLSKGLWAYDALELVMSFTYGLAALIVGTTAAFVDYYNPPDSLIGLWLAIAGAAGGACWALVSFVLFVSLAQSMGRGF